MTNERRFAAVPLGAAYARLPGCAFRVLLAICASADKSGRAWPGVTEISRRTGIARGHVPAAIKRLEEVGLLRAERQPGRVALYRIAYDAAPAVEVSPATGTPLDGDTLPEVSPKRGVPQTGAGVPQAGAKVSPGRGTKQTMSRPIEQIEEHTPSLSLGESGAPAKPDLRLVVIEGEKVEPNTTATLADGDEVPPETPSPAKVRAARGSKSHSAETEAAFSEFWRVYPRRDDRKPALKAYIGALKVASPAEILIGARAYAEYRRGEDPQYTKLGATWLRAEAWKNPPPPKAKPKPRTILDALRGEGAADDAEPFDGVTLDLSTEPEGERNIA